MKHSIRKLMLVSFTGLIFVMLISIFCINSWFLEQYYIANKQPALREVYDVLEEAVEEDVLTAEGTRNTLRGMMERGNIRFCVFERRNMDMALASASQDVEILSRQLLGYLLERNTNTDILEEAQEYKISKGVDMQTGSEYIEMWGDLPNSYIFIIRSPLESIRESVVISNKFLAYIGVGIILVAILFVWYFSKKITDPILELAGISQRMANLDFDTKYTRGEQNEIGILGDSFNRMSEELERTISELKSANNELKRDIAQKEKMEEMRTEFLGNVSHELKTPLALIQGYAEGLKEGISDDAQSREFYCDVIMDEAGKMNQMVKNLMTLNQLEFGDKDVQFERFNLTELVQGVIQSWDILIQQKEVQLQYLAGEKVYAWADEFKVEQVVRNYLSNALNHVDGERIIEVKIVEEEGLARVSVFNTGTPIPEGDVEHIWEKFYKVDKARTREYGGNGIGLSIVRAIMESFHQEYGVHNYDNGVEFYFTLDVK